MDLLGFEISLRPEFSIDVFNPEEQMVQATEQKRKKNKKFIISQSQCDRC